MLTTNRPERVEPGAVLHDGDDRSMVVASSRPHQNGWIVQFEGVAGREGADALRGRSLFAAPLEDPDELWVHELIGARVSAILALISEWPVRHMSGLPPIAAMRSNSV